MVYVMLHVMLRVMFEKMFVSNGVDGCVIGGEGCGKANIGIGDSCVALTTENYSFTTFTLHIDVHPPFVLKLILLWWGFWLIVKIDNVTFCS